MTKLKCALEENKQLRILDAEKTAKITSQAAQIVVQAARIAHLELLVEKLTFQFAHGGGMYRLDSTISYLTTGDIHPFWKESKADTRWKPF